MCTYQLPIFSHDGWFEGKPIENGTWSKLIKENKLK